MYPRHPIACFLRPQTVVDLVPVVPVVPALVAAFPAAGHTAGSSVAVACPGGGSDSVRRKGFGEGPLHQVEDNAVVVHGGRAEGRNVAAVHRVGADNVVAVVDVQEATRAEEDRIDRLEAARSIAETGLTFVRIYSKGISEWDSWEEQTNLVVLRSLPSRVVLASSASLIPA